MAAFSTWGFDYMATGTQARVLKALCDKLAALTFSPVLTVAYPGVTFPAQGAAKPDNYLEVTFLPNQTRQVTMGTDPQQVLGILQVSVIWKAGQGFIKPLDIAASIISHFRGAVLLENDCRVTVTQEPWAAAPIQETDRVKIPVSIPYQAFEKEA